MNFLIVLTCLIFSWTCFFQFSLLSRCKPRYLTESAWGSSWLLNLIFGIGPLLSVNVICTHLVVLILILLLFVHPFISFKWFCKVLVAFLMPLCVNSIAVSSAKVYILFLVLRVGSRWREHTRWVLAHCLEAVQRVSFWVMSFYFCFERRSIYLLCMILVLDISLLILFLEAFEADLRVILYRMFFLRLRMLLHNILFLPWHELCYLSSCVSILLCRGFV